MTLRKLIAPAAALGTLLVAESMTVAQAPTGRPTEELAIASRAETTPESDETEAVLRRARNRYFNNPWGWVITEDTGGRSVIVDHVPSYIPELPITTSTTIVVASVQLAAAFVSQDERQVYSEYALRVERAVKDATANEAKIEAVAPGDTIHALRSGGALRLLSGRVVEFRSSGFAQPQIGRSYVFFLKRVPEIEAYAITTAYLVKDATVQSMDSGEHFPQIVDKPLEAFLREIEAEVGTAF